MAQRVWQGGELVSPTTTLNREAVPIGDDIEPVGGSRVDVDTQNEEEESQEAGILKFEVIQKKPTSRQERELEDCGHSVHTRIGVALVSNIVAQENIFNLNCWRKKEENEQRYQ